LRHAPHEHVDSAMNHAAGSTLLRMAADSADDRIDLLDLDLISRYSLAVRMATAPLDEVVAALRNDLAWLEGLRRSGRPRPAPATRAAAAKSTAAGKPAPAKKTATARKAGSAERSPAKKATGRGR
jgi:hypothetical protein